MDFLSRPHILWTHLTGDTSFQPQGHRCGICPFWQCVRIPIFSAALWPGFLFPSGLVLRLAIKKKRKVYNLQLSYLHIGKTHAVCEGGLGLWWFSFQAALALLVLTFLSSHKYLWKPFSGQDVLGHTLPGSQKQPDVSYALPRLWMGRHRK